MVIVPNPAALKIRQLRFPAMDSQQEVDERFLIATEGCNGRFGSSDGGCGVSVWTWH
jgi:hypothetical protein